MPSFRNSTITRTESVPRSQRAVTIRPLRSHSDLLACVELQKQIWGENFTEWVPPSILKVSQRIGGVTAGAFDPEGSLLGFVFGLTGVEKGEVVHWSDMLAVRPEARNLGLGQRLKQFQADTLRPLGVSKIYWTYDPLVARNAHLNLNKLGARVAEYVPDMYGDTDSDLHRLGTDRFVVVWRIDGRKDESRPRLDLPADAENTPILNALVGDGGLSDVDAPVVRVEIPASIELVQRTSLEEARRWRTVTRAAFVPALERGYRVAEFYRDGERGPCYYVLARPRDSEDEDE